MNDSDEPLTAQPDAQALIELSYGDLDPNKLMTDSLVEGIEKLSALSLPGFVQVIVTAEFEESLSCGERLGVTLPVVGALTFELGQLVAVALDQSCPHIPRPDASGIPILQLALGRCEDEAVTVAPMPANVAG